MFSADLGGYTPSLPAATDPPFQKVALLLHGDGTNGAQNNTFVDYSYPGGYAVSFDGTGDYLTVPSATALQVPTQDFTIEGWSYLSTLPTSNNAVILSGKGKVADSNLEYSVQVFNDAGNCVLRLVGSENGSIAGVISQASTGYITANQWFHWAVTRVGTTVKLWVNGVNVQTTTSAPATLYSGTGALSIGSNNAGVSAITGYISNVRIVKGTALYTSNFVPSNQPLTAVSGTSLLTCQSATIVDNSPNAFTITANGDAAAVSSKTITRTGNVAQGTFSPFSLAEGQWSTVFNGTGGGGTSSVATSTSGFAFGTGDFTVEFWIYPNLPSSTWNNSNMYLFTTSSANIAYIGHIIYYSPTIGTSSPLYTSGGQITPFTWTHVAIVRSSGTTSIYLNGTLSVSGSDATNWTSSVATIAQNLSLGANISNLRVTNTAVYTTNFTPPTSSLTAISGTQLLTFQSNRFVDNSSNNFTLTTTGTPKVTAWSPFAPSAAYSASTNGGSGYFDGSGDYLTTPAGVSNFGTGDFTVEFWTNYASQTGAYDFVDARGSNYNNQGFAVYIYNGSIYVTWSTNNHIITTAPAANVWNHIAVCRASGVTKLYLNGVQTGSTPTDTNNYGDYYVNVGQLAGGGSGYNLNGYMSNVRIVNGTAVYTANFTPPTAPLTAISGTSLLLNCTNAAIYDNAIKNDVETVGNAQISTSVKKYGTGSMYFDGAGDYLKIANADTLTVGTGDYTVEFFVYQTSVSGTQVLVEIGRPTSGPSAGFQIDTISGVIQVYAGSTTGTNIITASTSQVANTWYHIAMTRASGSTKLFINGVQSGSTATDTANYNQAYTWVGANAGGGSAYLNGYIDDLRITKGQALYTSNFTPPTQAFPNV